MICVVRFTQHQRHRVANERRSSSYYDLVRVFSQSGSFGSFGAASRPSLSRLSSCLSAHSVSSLQAAAIVVAPLLFRTWQVLV